MSSTPLLSCGNTIRMLFLFIFLSISSPLLTALRACVPPSCHNSNFNACLMGKEGCFLVWFSDGIYQKCAWTYKLNRAQPYFSPKYFFSALVIFFFFFITKWIKVRGRFVILSIRGRLQPCCKMCVYQLHTSCVCFFWLSAIYYAEKGSFVNDQTLCMFSNQ